MDQKNAFLGTEPIGRLLFRLAIPTVIAQLVNMLYNIVDRIYIGHMPQVGSLALTGLGVCTPIILIVSAFAALVASGGAPRASISMGKGDLQTAEKMLGGCFSLQLGISAVLTAALLIWNRDLLLAFGASGQTIDYAADYMQIYAIGTVFVQLTLGMNAFITAQGFAREDAHRADRRRVQYRARPDPDLQARHGCARRCAGDHRLTGRVVPVGRAVPVQQKSVLKLRVQNFLQSPRLILPCVGLGTATFIMQASESVLSVCFNSSLARYGGDIAVGAMTILTSVMQFALLPLQGISQGAQPILSYNYGAKNVERVRKTFRVLLTVCLTYSALIWAFVMLCPRVFAGIFTPDAELIEFTGRALRIYCAVLAIFGIQQACQITFVSIGKAVCSIIVAVMRKFVLLIPLIYLMPHLVPDPTLGVYLAEPVADTLAVTFTSILFSHQFRKALRTLESERSA